jgi:hypothetical protein
LVLVECLNFENVLDIFFAERVGIRGKQHRAVHQLCECKCHEP